jgi:hypothetical protein
VFGLALLAERHHGLIAVRHLVPTLVAVRVTTAGGRRSAAALVRCHRSCVPGKLDELTAGRDILGPRRAPSIGKEGSSSYCLVGADWRGGSPALVGSAAAPVAAGVVAPIGGSHSLTPESLAQRFRDL